MSSSAKRDNDSSNEAKQQRRWQYPQQQQQQQIIEDDTDPETMPPAAKKQHIAADDSSLNQGNGDQERVAAQQGATAAIAIVGNDDEEDCEDAKPAATAGVKQDPEAATTLSGDCKVAAAAADTAKEAAATEDPASPPGDVVSAPTASGESKTAGEPTADSKAGAPHVPDDPHERTSKDYYFDSYSHHSIHEEMLKDEVRTKTYQMAILQNQHLFENKIVLDVGCGTGILSMFAAQAGAKHVYAVDCSSILEQAKRICETNGFGPDKITLIRGKIEEIELPVDKVDIIVSEWMGYFLLYESMLDTVIYARDKWLVPNGIILPDKAVMYVAGIEDGHVKRERFDFWKDVYGFDMSAIKDIAIREPVVDVVDAKSIVTDSKPILHLDILACTREDLQFTSKFRLQAQRNDFIHGLVCYFEVAFTQVHKPIGFSTAPFARYTHWKQTIFYMEEALTICAGETVSGELSCQPNKRNRRDLDICLSLNFQGRYSKLKKEGTTVHYRLR